MADCEKQAVFTFPGIIQWESLDWTDCAGFAPSTAIIEMYPQRLPPKLDGDLVITQGNVKVTCANMRIFDAVYQPGSGGQVVSIKLADERWRWSNGYVIHGLYNPRLADGTVDRTREKTPIELIELVFKAMGVENYDADLFKTDPDIANDRPSVSWDVAVPATEGQRLCDLYGCRLVPQRSTGKFVICKTGVGKFLPENYPYVDPSFGVDPSEHADAVQVFGAPIKYQVRLELEAVGKEIRNPAIMPSPIPDDPNAPQPTDNADGSWKPIDQLTYAPNIAAAGQPKVASWENESDYCENVSQDRIQQPDGSYQVARELAQQTVRKVYRVKEDSNGFVAIPGYTDPTSGSGSNLVRRKQIVLLTELAQQFTNTDGSKSYFPAFCDFIGWHELSVGEGNSKAGTRLDLQPSGIDDPNESVSMQIDPAQWLVTFSVPLRRYADGTSSDAKYPAKVWLNTCVHIRHPETWQPIRYSLVKAAPGGDALSKFVLPLQKDDIQRNIVNLYTIDETTGDGVASSSFDNVDECRTKAGYYIDSTIKTFETVQQKTLTYLQIAPIDMDGAIQQISYTISKSGADTKASRGTEHDLQAPTYRQNRERVLRGDLAVAKDLADTLAIRQKLKDLAP